MCIYTSFIPISSPALLYYVVLGLGLGTEEVTTILCSVYTSFIPISSPALLYYVVLGLGLGTEEVTTILCSVYTSFIPITSPFLLFVVFHFVQVVTSAFNDDSIICCLLISTTLFLYITIMISFLSHIELGSFLSLLLTAILYCVLVHLLFFFVC